MRDAPALEAKSVDAGYGRDAEGKPKTMVLRDVNVAIETQQTVGIIGESENPRLPVSLPGSCRRATAD